MPAPSVEGDPFSVSYLPLAKTPVDKNMQSIIECQGPDVAWDTILNRVLDVSGIVYGTDELCMDNAAFRDDGEVLWFEGARPDIAKSTLVDPETGTGITLLLNGYPSGETDEKTGAPLYSSSRRIVSVIGYHAGPQIKADFTRGQLLPTAATIIRGHHDLPSPGTYEDSTTPTRANHVEGVTEVSVIRLLSATYRATKQMKIEDF